MARPSVEFKVKRNGSSLQFYEKGDYCGSLPIKYLCRLAKANNDRSTILD